MPYINKTDRVALLMYTPVMRDAGSLNYAITALLINYVAHNGGLRYKTLNDCIGALVAAKDEFTRRVVAPYVDKKIQENGDVYPPELLKGGR